MADSVGKAGGDGFDIGEPVDDLELARLPMTDLGNRDRLLKRRGRDLADNDDDLLTWDRRRWAIEPKSLPGWTLAAQETAEAIQRRELPALIAEGEKDDVAKAWVASFRKFAKESASVAAISNMIKAARPHRRVPRDLWNAQAHLLNVANCTLSIAPEGLTELGHRREHLITHVTGAAYDPRATCPKFEAAMAEWFCEADERAFMQRLLGSMLIDSSSDQAFIVWQGVGGDGKGVLLNTLRHVLGDYVMTMDANSLLASQKDGAAPSPDVARLMCQPRLVVAEEPERGRTLAENMIKAMTGTGKVPTRDMYRGIVEFTPRFKLILVCNELPMVKGGDEGIWRRLIRVKWRRAFAEDERDWTLESKLAAEASGILNWLITGCYHYLERGLDPPARVRADTLEWRDISDHLGRFLAECCERKEDARIEVGVLYDCYAAWAKREGQDRILTKAQLGRALTAAKQIPTAKSNGMKFRLGFTLKPDAPRGGDRFDDDPRGDFDDD